MPSASSPTPDGNGGCVGSAGSSAACVASGVGYGPMYGAGRLERKNIGEYERAARYAVEAGHPEFVDDLIEMSEVEWDHERYFREKSQRHWMWRVSPRWSPPPPRDTIRAGVPGVGPAKNGPNLVR
jgi:hypothetical protein